MYLINKLDPLQTSQCFSLFINVLAGTIKIKSAVLTYKTPVSKGAYILQCVWI